MSTKKKNIRRQFRQDVFRRDNIQCVMCGVGPYDFGMLGNGPAIEIEEILDAHHITPREDMPNGGYVKENGVSLCKDKCHLMAEEYLQGTNLHEGFSPEELYEKIGSSLQKAIRESEKLT